MLDDAAPASTSRRVRVGAHGRVDMTNRQTWRPQRMRCRRWPRSCTRAVDLSAATSTLARREPLSARSARGEAAKAQLAPRRARAQRRLADLSHARTTSCCALSPCDVVLRSTITGLRRAVAANPLREHAQARDRRLSGWSVGASSYEHAVNPALDTCAVCAVSLYSVSQADAHASSRSAGTLVYGPL